LYKSVVPRPVRRQVLLQHLINQFRTPDTQRAIPGIGLQAQKLSSDFSTRYPLRMLVAEDNQVNQLLMEKVLGRLGYTPDMVENGLLATEMAAQTYYDLIFMDVQMPEMDGLEATRVIRANGLRQPCIIAMTANALQDDQQACLQAGMDDYLSKPVNLEEMMGRLVACAARHPKDLAVGNL
jgi:CheY-like chemotaxis protein